MQKKFVSSLVLLLLVNFLVKPLWIFGIDLKVQNLVGASQYGLYAAILSFSMIFNMIQDLGLSHYSNRSVARNPGEVSSNFSSLIGLKLFLGLVYLVVAITLGLTLGYSHFALLAIIVLSQVFSSLVLFFRSHLSGLHLFTQDSIMSVLDKALMVIGCGFLIYTRHFENESFSILLFAKIQCFSYFITAVTGAILVGRQVSTFKVKLNLKNFGSRLRQSIPYALLIFLMAIYSRVDAVMLQQISGNFENGIYFQGFRLLESVNQLGYLFSVLLLPMFSGMISRNEPIKNLSQLTFTLITVLTLAISLACYFTAPQLMDWLYTDHPELSAPVFKLLIFSSVFFGSNFIFGTLLTARGNLKTLNRIAFSGFVLNILLNLLLIPFYGAMGAVIATLSTQGVTAVIQIILSFRLANFSFELHYWLKLGGLIIFGIVGCSLLQTQTHINWYYIFGGSVAIVLLGAAILRLLPLKEAILLLRQRFTQQS